MPAASTSNTSSASPSLESPGRSAASRRRHFNPLGWLLDEETPIRRTLRVFLRLAMWSHVLVYRLTRGRVGARVPGGIPVLLLTTTGRITGKRRTVPLAYVEQDDEILAIAGSGGSRRDPAWYRNLQSQPHVDVHIRGRRMACEAQTIQGVAREELVARAQREWPLVVASGERAQREIPFVKLVPVER